VPLKLPCVGGHGVEWRIADGAPIQRRHAKLSPLLKTQVTAAVTVDPRIIVEDKGTSLAVHYRLAPERGRWSGTRSPPSSIAPRGRNSRCCAARP
jgi:trehalose 6-phosphate phosphatase